MSAERPTEQPGNADPASPNPSEEAKQQHVAVQQLQYEATITSPFPPPHLIAAYEEAMPGLAKRLIALVEQETKHRQQLELQQLNAAIEDEKAERTAATEDARAERAERRLGQLLGFGIGAIAIGAGAYTAVAGAEFAGSLIGGGGVIGLVTVFILGRALRRAEESPSPDAQEGRQAGDA